MPSTDSFPTYDLAELEISQSDSLPRKRVHAQKIELGDPTLISIASCEISHHVTSGGCCDFKDPFCGGLAHLVRVAGERVLG